MKSPTLSDVARTAGVSYATADRVINKRGNVAEKSVRKVEDAVSSLGYVRNLAAANLSRGRKLRFAFLLPKGRNAFFTRMRVHLQSLLAHVMAEQISVEIIEIDAFAVEELCQSLTDLSEACFDGVAVVGLQSPQIEAPLKVLQDKGVAVVGLVSDLPKQHRAAYIGIDNVAAGRTAARLMGLAHGGRAGRVQVFAGSEDALDHRDRIAGFRAVMEADFPHISLPEPIITRDAADVLESEMGRVLRRAGISGVYNAGAGNSGLARAMNGAARPAQFCCIVHELVTHSREALLSGHVDLVIDQSPEVEVRRALTFLRALAEARDIPPLPDLVPTIYVRDNLPPELTSN